MPQPAGTKPPTILFLDTELVAIDKPAHLLSVPGRAPEPSAPDLLRQRPELRDNPAVRVVHRLDRDASGVQVYARTLSAQRHLVAEFVGRRVEKVYFALVSGYVSGDGEVDLRLAFDRRRDRVIASRSRGKPALTRYHVLQRLASNTLLECHPVTGRMHQIRAHLAAIGHPLTVDPVYGSGSAVLLSQYKTNYRASARRPERPLIDRLTLHAGRIQFAHPVTGQPLAIEAPWPKDFRATVNQLGRLVQNQAQ